MTQPNKIYSFFVCSFSRELFCTLNLFFIDLLTAIFVVCVNSLYNYPCPKICQRGHKAPMIPHCPAAAMLADLTTAAEDGDIGHP